MRKWKGGYVDAGSKVYFIRRQLRGRRFHVSTRRTTLEGALAELAKFESDPEAYLRGDGQGSDFATAVPAYLAYSAGVRLNGRRHVRRQGQCFDRWHTFLATRGITRLPQVHELEVDAFIGWRRAGGATPETRKDKTVGPDAIRLDVAALKSLFSWAYRVKLIPENPLRDYAIPRGPRRSKRVKTFPLEAWQAVRPHLAETWQFAGDVLLASGMRYGSLATLPPDNVNTVENAIFLAGNAIKGKDGVTIPVEHDVAVEARAVTLRGIPDDEGGQFRDALEKACLAAGVDRITGHMFRHSHTSFGLAAGVSLRDMQTRLAHASYRTTENYSHTLGAGSGWRGINPVPPKAKETK